MEVLTLAELKDLCRRRGLPTTGSKAALIELLVRSHMPEAPTDSVNRRPETVVPKNRVSSSDKNYDAMTVPLLNALCHRRSLRVGGIKADIVARLKAKDASEAPPEDQSTPTTAAATGTNNSQAGDPDNKRDGGKTRKDVEGANTKKDTKRALVFHSNTGTEASSAGPAAPSVASAPSKHVSKKDTSTKNASTMKAAGQPAALAAPAAEFVLTSPSKACEMSPGAKKRKTPLSAATSPSPSKPRKTQRLFALQSPGTASPIKMVQLSFAQCLTKQKPAPDTLQQYLKSHSLGPPSLSEYVTADKRTKAPSVSAPKQRVFLVYTAKTLSAHRPVMVFTSLSDANARVREEFYEKHPAGWSSKDVMDRTDAVNVKYNDDLLTMSMRPPHNPWTVGVAAVAIDSTNVSMTGECFVVVSRTSKTTETHDSTPTVTFCRVFTTKEAANAFASSVFEAENPWKWTKTKLAQEGGVNRLTDGDMISLSKKGSDGVEWTVSVVSAGVGDAHKAQEIAKRNSTAQQASKRKASTRETSQLRSPVRPLSTSDRKVQPAASQDCFVVYSSYIFREERRGKRKVPEYEFYPPMKTAKDAKAVAEAVFYKLNPWGWTKREFVGKPIQKTSDLIHRLKMSVLNTDTWEVCVAVVSGLGLIETDTASGIVVYSVQGSEKSPERHQSDPRIKIETILPPHEVTGTRMEELFCKHNPYGWTRSHFHSEKAQISKTFDDGLFTVSAQPVSKPSWEIKCAPFTHRTVPESSLEESESPQRAATEVRVKAEH